MKKPLIALSFAVASALALADNVQYKSDWFTGIGTGATGIEALGASNGKWLGLTTENASVKDGALVLTLDEDDDGVAEEATFEISDSSEAGATQTLTVTGDFTPIAKDDLLSGAAMTAKKAQVGFAVVTEDSGRNFYVWVGAADGDAASKDWQCLSSTDANAASLASADGVKTLSITLFYSPTAITADFSVSGTVTTTAEGETETSSTVSVSSGAIALMGGAKTVAETNKAIASVSCTGSGSLAAVNGTCNYAVAEGVKADGTAADGWKFDTAGAAIAASQATGGSGNVILRKAVDGEVSFSGYLCVHYDSGVSDLSENIKTNFKAAEGSAQTRATTGGSTLLKNGAYKEWSLTDDVLLAVKINEKVIGGGMWSESATSADSDFRKFLLNNCAVYRNSSATSEQIQSALLESGPNGYPLWQSFVMGVVDANESVKLAPAETDTASDAISLTLANKIPASPYASSLKYTITKNGTAGTATAISRASPVVKIPLETGHYSVKFTIGE